MRQKLRVVLVRDLRPMTIMPDLSHFSLRKLDLIHDLNSVRQFVREK